MQQQINELVDEIETLMGNLMPDGGASHHRFVREVQRFPDTGLRRQFQKSIARRDFATAKSTLRQMMQDRHRFTPRTCGA